MVERTCKASIYIYKTLQMTRFHRPRVVRAPWRLRSEFRPPAVVIEYCSRILLSTVIAPSSHAVFVCTARTRHAFRR